MVLLLELYLIVRLMKREDVLPPVPSLPRKKEPGFIIEHAESDEDIVKQFTKA